MQEVSFSSFLHQVSTSSEISDYSGDEGLKKKPKSMIVLGMQEQELDYKMPSYSHVAIAKMMEKNKNVKFIVTSNHDNLHQKGGTKLNDIANLFGNAYVEECGKCKKLYQRTVVTPAIGRVCDDEKCGGRLSKTQTRMNSPTPEIPLKLSLQHSQKADLAIVLGSSMTVSPFCELPQMAKKICLVTLQDTPYDDKVDLKINSRCDDVMKFLVPDIESFVFIQKFLLKWKKKDQNILLSIEPGRLNEPLKCVESAIIDKVDFSEKKEYFEATIQDQKSFILKIKFKEEYHLDDLKENIEIQSDSGEKELKLEKKILFKK